MIDQLGEITGVAGQDRFIWPDSDARRIVSQGSSDRSNHDVVEYREGRYRVVSS